MTLTTHVYTFSESNVHETFHFLRRLLGAKPETAFTDGPEIEWRDGERFPDPSGKRSIGNCAGQGLCALMWIDYRDEAPARTPEEAAEHYYCVDDCDGSGHQPPCWLDISLDTPYGYRDEYGGCGALHARLVAQLGQWLDAKGIRWAWVNGFTGEIHGGPDRLARLADLAA